MKLIVLISVISILLSSSSDCNRKTKDLKLKGKLEIQGICSNYTIKLLEGYIDTSLIEATWTDEVTKKIHTNVFALGNPCNFPETIKQGDDFYFSVDSSVQKPCMVCLAYYPKPKKSLAIKVFRN